MHFHISPHDGVPIYLQIVNQVKYLVASGRLVEGEELPPIRVLAEQLLVNPNTIARAYRELETAGLATKRHGSGTYISGAGSPLSHRERIRILTDRVDAILVEARQLNIPIESVLEILRQRNQVLGRMTQENPEEESPGSSGASGSNNISRGKEKSDHVR